MRTEAARVHSPDWLAAAQAVRSELQFPLGTEQEIEEWLTSQGPARVLARVADGFAGLRTPAGRYPRRYFPYFLACVLSDHPGGTVAHTLPPELAVIDPPFRASDRRVDYYTLWYFPEPAAQDGHRWVSIAPPAAFELHWPKTDWYPRRGEDPDPDQRKAWDERVNEVQQRTFAALGNTRSKEFGFQQVYLPGWRYRTRSGERWDLPVRVARPPKLKYRVQGQPESEEPMAYDGQRWSLRRGPQSLVAAPIDSPTFLRPGSVQFTVTPSVNLAALLPLDGPIIPTWTPIIVPYFQHVAMGIEIAGGSLLGDLLDPVVVLDPNADAGDREKAHICELMSEAAWTARQLVWRRGGQPRVGGNYPGQDPLERATQILRSLLADEPYTPSKERMVKLAKRAARQVEREFAGQDRAPLPRRWWRGIR